MSCGDGPASGGGGRTSVRVCMCVCKWVGTGEMDPPSSSVSFCPSCGCRTQNGAVLSHKDLGECICPSAGNEGLGRVEGHVMNSLIMLLPVGGDLLHTSPVFQHPQAH